MGRLLPEPAAGRSRSRSSPNARVQIEDVTHNSPTRHRLAILTAAPKGPRLDWLIEKCTELGVDELILAEFERSVVRLASHSAARYARATIEATKQCGRAWLPELRCGEPLQDAVRRQDGRILVCDPSRAGQSLVNFLTRAAVPDRLAVVVGPEGGLSPTEQAWLAEHQAVPVRLSSTILRIETAAAAVAAVWAAVRCDAESG